LGEEIQRVIDDEGMIYIIATAMFIEFVLLEWWRFYKPSTTKPWVVTMMTVLVVGYSIFRILRSMKIIRSLRLGMHGEKSVGQTLEELRANGASVFHDICANDFNVDHVVVSPHGIFVIETKTRSKPNGRKATVRYDGDKILVDGKAPSRDPIKQVRASTTWVQELLKESTGKYFPARPVVLFPEWYVETLNAKAHDKVWVLNPKCFSSFVQNEKADFTPEDVKLIAFHLSSYIRSRQ
jgi:hypothetical protein